MPAAAVLVAVAMSAAVGCVSVSPPTERTGPHRLTRGAAPEDGPGPARESLVTVGGGPAREGSTDPAAPSPALPPGPSWGPEHIRPWDPPWLPGRDPARGADAGPRRPAGQAAPGEPAREAERPAGSPGSAARPPAAGPAPASREAPPASAPQRQAPPAESRRVEPRPDAGERREAPRQEAPRQEMPAPAPDRRGQKGRGVCALGDTYGKWQKGEDASRICHQVYGN
ncbi:hypothetical protein GCM10018779_57430 [Streptomyces griseocarneus]|nr:hypothetical protein GCM10018779_57430 [Streptomyces griseocarneus]